MMTPLVLQLCSCPVSSSSASTPDKYTASLLLTYDSLLRSLVASLLHHLTVDFHLVQRRNATASAWAHPSYSPFCILVPKFHDSSFSRTLGATPARYEAAIRML